MNSFAPYPAYKNSGVEWIGDIPASWSTQPFFSVAQETRRSNKGMVEDNLLSLSYGNIVNKDITTNEGLLPASFETYQIIEPGDMVFRLTDLQNDKRSLRSALVVQRGIITSAYLAVKPKGIDHRYFSYAMRDADSRKVFYSMGGGLRQSMKYDDMKWLDIICPSSPEQKAIADYLDRETAEIDAFISLQEILVELLNERHIATITSAVTKGLDPTEPMEEKGLAWIDEAPRHWTTLKLSRLGIQQESGVSVNGYSEPAEADQVGVLKTGAASKGYFDPSENKRVVDEDLQRVSCPIRQGWLLVNRANTPELVGSCAYVSAPQPNLYLSDKLWQINFKLASNPFMSWWMKSPSYKSQLEFHRVGASATMQNLSFADFKSFDIALPPLEEQYKISSYLERETAEINVAIAEAREAISLSKERRAALISAAVTGKIDVRNWRGSTERVLEAHGIA